MLLLDEHGGLVVIFPTVVLELVQADRGVQGWAWGRYARS